ncbi:MAG TPA: site-specific integrase [Acidimicrobiales bacterium]|nr:site-specific integrase [Acidimicrobiales bacterium]
MALPTLPLSGRPLADVSVYSVQRRSVERHKRPWITRWSVNGRQRSRAFRTKSEAERFRSGLLVAVQSGEAFDEATGEPLSWQPLPDQVRAHEWARRWLAEQWPEWAPRTRVSAVEALTRLVPLLVAPTAPAPPTTLRSYLASSLRPDGSGRDDEAERWLEQWCLQLGQLSRPVLAVVDRRLVVRDDGEPLGPATAGRFRKVSRACIRRAVELGILDADPWPPPPRGRSKRKATRITRTASIRSLPDPATMATVIDAIASHQPASRTYRVMTAVAYYAGLRPSEVVMIRARALELPENGWGRIDVTEADVAFDQPGEPKTGPRSVPIPRQLVDLLQDWVDERGYSGDDLLFRTRTGRRPTASNWSRAFQRALRESGCSPLRIYDCRHAAATTWLGAGVPLGEVAKRMGHSVETLVSTYVGALAGDETFANERIEAVLAGPKKSSASRGAHPQATERPGRLPLKRSTSRLWTTSST